MQRVVSFLQTVLVSHGGLEAQDGEDDDAGEHGSEAVGEGHHESVLVAIVIDWIVGGEGNETAESQTQGEENLGSCLQPNNRIGDGVPLEWIKSDCELITNTCRFFLKTNHFVKKVTIKKKN